MSFGVGWTCSASIERASGGPTAGSMYAAGDPTAYFWVHLLLAVTSFVLGTGIGVLGLRGVRAARHGNG
ncbi:SCO4848 family membrane protein [Streptomyces zaomyceticus]|uniref:SCO4848 family membrane protein n=1 Tax=Streptomyces zaomyceticus TaxID=68286 RepID=UPI0036864EB2